MFDNVKMWVAGAVVVVILLIIAGQVSGQEVQEDCDNASNGRACDAVPGPVDQDYESPGEPTNNGRDRDR